MTLALTLFPVLLSLLAPLFSLDLSPIYVIMDQNSVFFFEILCLPTDDQIEKYQIPEQVKSRKGWVYLHTVPLINRPINCRKVSKSDLSEENLNILTKDRQKMKKGNNFLLLKLIIK